jgi:septal ring factor EnvC (AmiA/AmiB activator)
LRLTAGRAAVAVFTVAACARLPALQTDRTQETEALSRRAAERLKSLRDEADRLTLEARTVLGDLRRLELAREIAAEELRQAERDVAAVAGERNALDAQIAAMEQEALIEGPELRARLVSLYKLGRGRYVRLLLSTSDIRQIGQAARMVGLLASQDRDRIAAHRQRLEELGASRRHLQDRLARLAVLREAAERARASADQAVAARNTLIAEIDQRRDLNAQLAGELLAAQQKLQTTLAEVSSTSPPTLPIGPFRGDLDWPVAGTVRQRFGAAGDARGVARTGVDLAAQEGEPVHALHEGTVAFADVFTGFGRLVIVDHGGRTFSLYGNLKDLQVARGARIARGAILGTVGVSPTGAAGLYFELRIDGRPVDPLQWLKRQ